MKNAKLMFAAVLTGLSVWTCSVFAAADADEIVKKYTLRRH